MLSASSAGDGTGLGMLMVDMMLIGEWAAQQRLHRMLYTVMASPSQQRLHIYGEDHDQITEGLHIGELVTQTH
jgi:hypothetical protein